MYRVLVVDDEPDYCRWVKTLLSRSADFQVVGEARDGDEGIRLIKLLAPDVMILDVYMPGPDGFEVARYAHEHFPGIKAIVISAQEDNIYQRLAEENGARAFIPKAKLSIPALQNALRH